MDSKTPLVSVVLPTQDRLPLLREAVASVFAQSYEHWELLIVDDGSSPETREYLSSLSDSRVRRSFLSWVGMASKLRNAGIAIAGGELVAFLDSDDRWHPQKLERQIGQLTNHPERRWSYTGFSLIDEHGAPLAASDYKASSFEPQSGWIVRALLEQSIAVPTPSVIVQRALLTEVGGFDESFRFCEHHELWLRLAERSQVDVVPEALCDVRLHQGSSTRDPSSPDRGHPERVESWIRLYRNFAASHHDAALKSICRRQQAYYRTYAASERLARGELLAAGIQLGSALRARPTYPRAWKVGLKALLAPALRKLRRPGV